MDSGKITSFDETYVHVSEPPLGCPIHVFGGEADHMVAKAELDAWRQQTTGGFARHLFPGGHFYLNESGGPSLVRMVTAELESLMSQH